MCGDVLEVDSKMKIQRGRHADMEKKERLLESDGGAERVSGSSYDKVLVVATMDKDRAGMASDRLRTPNLIVVVEQKCRDCLYPP
jgi:hypothetical protein